MAKYEDYAKKQTGVEEEPTDDQTTQSEAEPGQAHDQTSGQTEQITEVPEKYRGKSTEELVRMHQELEGRFGTQGNEVGELRKLVNKLIDEDLNKAPESGDDTATTDDLNDLDFFANPEEAITKLVDNHPTVKQAGRKITELDQQAASAEILRRHSDVDQVFQDEKFREWVQKSPHRQRQLLAAHQSFDVDAADAILSDWKEIKKATEPAETQTTTTVKSEPADTTAADNGSVRGRGRGNGGKIIYRTDIRKLQREDPKRYQEMLPEIRKAHVQGRVRD